MSTPIHFVFLATKNGRDYYIDYQGRTWEKTVKGFILRAHMGQSKRQSSSVQRTGGKQRE